jgi:hypothetical protein
MSFLGLGFRTLMGSIPLTYKQGPALSFSSASFQMEIFQCKEVVFDPSITVSSKAS